MESKTILQATFLGLILSILTSLNNYGALAAPMPSPDSETQATNLELNNNTTVNGTKKVRNDVERR